MKLILNTEANKDFYLRGSDLKRGFCRTLLKKSYIEPVKIDYLCKLRVMNQMGRILAIDYGKKRVGLAVSDPLKIIATRLTTISSDDIWNFLDDYFIKEEVELVLIGYPRQLNNEPSEAINYINPFLKKFQAKYGNLALKLMDERFTSKMAFQAMIDAGVKKSERRNKGLVDGVSATIILQSHLEEQKYL